MWSDVFRHAYGMTDSFSFDRDESDYLQELFDLDLLQAFDLQPEDLISESRSGLDPGSDLDLLTNKSYLPTYVIIIFNCLNEQTSC